MMAASRLLKILVALAALTPALPVLRSTVDQGDGIERVSTGGPTRDTQMGVVGSGLQGVLDEALWGSDSSTASVATTLDSNGCMPGEDAETCKKRKAAEAELAEEPSSEEDEPEPTPLYTIGQTVVVDKGRAVGVVDAWKRSAKGDFRYTVSFKGDKNKPRKNVLESQIRLPTEKEKWHPNVDDVVILTAPHGNHINLIPAGTFAKVVSFDKIDSHGREWLNVEFSNGQPRKIKVAEVRKAVGDEPKRFAAAYEESQDPPLGGAPIHLNAGAVSDAEVEQLGKKGYTALETSKFVSSTAHTLYENDKLKMPTAYDIDALRQVIPPLDQALVYADPSRTRVRRDDTYYHALKQLPDADVVKIAKELLEEFDKLSDELKKGGLQPGKVKAREQRAKGLAEAAQSREAIEAENQIEMDDSYCADGHDGAGFITDCELKDRARHSGNLKLSFTPAVCHPRRASYKKETCDGVTTAFNRVYDGGLKSFHGDLTYLLFAPESIRLFDERGFFIDILTGKGSGALLCRAGTKACNQIGPMVQYVVRSMNSFWKDELGLKSFDPDPTDEPHEALDRKIAALGLPFIKNGLLRIHPTAGKHGGPTVVFAGPVWRELEKLGVGHQQSPTSTGPREPLRFAELAVAVISIGGQLGYEIEGATMFCAYGADALAGLKDPTFDLLAEERKWRYAFADDWINDVLDKCRAGVDCPSITIYYRTQFANLHAINEEYWPAGGVGWDLGVLEPVCFTNPQKVIDGEACPELLTFLTMTANLAPGPGASRVDYHAVRDFLDSNRGHSSVLWAGQWEYSKNGGERVTHRCPFPTKVAVAMEVEGESSDVES